MLWIPSKAIRSKEMKGVFNGAGSCWSEITNEVKLATVFEDNPKAPFSIAATPICKGGRYSVPWIAPLYP